MQKALLFIALVLVAGLVAAEQPVVDAAGKFRQLGTLLPTPNVYRNAAGAPGHGYWQQRADYKIDVRLDERQRRVSASETITYTNESPDALSYLWLQLDQNRFNANSLERRSEAAQQNSETEDSTYSFSRMRRDHAAADTEYGYTIESVKRGNRKLPYTIVDTMMRIDLAEPLAPGSEIVFSVDWSFNVTEQAAVNSRGGYEYFPETDTYLYYLAQWFPRLVAYTDYTAWQHKQFLGRGEFTLEFGDYEVAITVPADHVVSATGELMNAEAVLSDVQRQRLARAMQEQRQPVFIVTPDEAKANEQRRERGNKTWRFTATNVRDFAFASSRKFIWDAMIHEQDDTANPVVLVMSFYPTEAQPIWSRYSTHAVAHTMAVYSRFSFPYPYPTSQSVNTWKGGGMEYPMITFNGYRPELTEVNEDDEQLTYSRSIKQSLIGVIIHEVGHNYFPMVVNSDERQWTWMDEGLNSFLQYVAEREWEENFHEYEESQSVLDHVIEYMLSEKQVPIMTQSDSILQFGPNAYTKPTAALMVLRETVMGRELFDFAFREYARRWMFKRPTPADFFRTLEDASAVDLDWFWRGWFYGTDHVDVALTRVREFQVSSQDPDIEFAENRKQAQREMAEPLIQKRNREEGRETYVESRRELEDFYNEHDKFTPSNKDRNDYREFLDDLEDWERAALERAVREADYIYFVDFANVGGLVSPLPLAITYADGSTGSYDIPAEIWRRNPDNVTKALVSDKRITAIELDPLQQTADADRSNNYFPQRIVPSRLELYKRDEETRDLMADMLAELKAEKDDKKALPLKPGN
ncbi:MAG: M1 family metallopeptidase [Gammaproteobacteria bacterium]|nr:M1 family metallopeptidase [Gammaproteobacteria bacterium]